MGPFAEPLPLPDHRNFPVAQLMAICRFWQLRTLLQGPGAPSTCIAYPSNPLLFTLPHQRLFLFSWPSVSHPVLQSCPTRVGLPERTDKLRQLKHEGVLPRIPAPTGKKDAHASLWFAPAPSKRWCEKFFLLNSVVWIVWALCIVVPFELYEVCRETPNATACSSEAEIDEMSPPCAPL